MPIATFESATASLTRPFHSTGDVLLSGWLLGGERLNGEGALVDVRKGKGHVVLFGFRPQYRARSMTTFPLIWNALLMK